MSWDPSGSGAPCYLGEGKDVILDTDGRPHACRNVLNARGPVRLFFPTFKPT